MTLARSYLDAVLAIVTRDVFIFASYRWRLVTQNLGVIFTLATFYYLSRLVRVQFSSPKEYFSYVVVGLVILQVVQSTFETSATMRQELVAGTFERLIVSPLGPLATVLSLLVFPLLYALVIATATLAVAAALFGLPVRWGTAALALPVAVMGALAFSSFSLVFAAAVLRFKQAPGTAYLLAAISLVAGLYFPVELLPSWIRWASDVQPFTPTVELLRHLLVGLPLNGSAWGYAGRIAAFTVVMLPCGIVIVAIAIRSARRRGTITEY